MLVVGLHGAPELPLARPTQPPDRPPLALARAAPDAVLPVLERVDETLAAHHAPAANGAGRLEALSAIGEEVDLWMLSTERVTHPTRAAAQLEQSPDVHVRPLSE